MKRISNPLFVAVAALAVSGSFAGVSSAALRVPQKAVLGGSLQAYLNGVGESINVLTQQDATQVWTHTTSTTTTFTIMVEQSPNANLNIVGMYNASAGGAPPLYVLLPGALTPDAFATATFRPGGVLEVSRFDANALPSSSQTYNGVDPTAFCFYIQGPNGTYYTQDYRNPGGNAQALSYQGTGGNAGTWWLCFEETSVAAGSDQDFDDSVILMESVNPTPTLTTSWGQLKARFR